MVTSTRPVAPDRPTAPDRTVAPDRLNATERTVTPERPAAADHTIMLDRPVAADRPITAGASAAESIATGRIAADPSVEADRSEPRPASSPEGPGTSVAVIPVAPSRTPVSRPAGESYPVPEAPQRAGRLHSRTYKVLLSALGVLVLLTVCGLSSWLIVIDERKGTDARAGAPGPTVVPRDISSRQSDPAPLTVNEVFPEKQIVINKAEPPYKVLKTVASRNCATAAAGEIAKLLKEMGCSQVVRGTMRSPTGDYLVTGGIFNLEEKAGAEFLREKIQPIVNRGKGRFPGMVAGKGTEPVALSSAHVGWDIRGHYLIYCVIARADGKDFADADPYARQILFDIVEMHLRDKVLEKRATETVGPDAPTK